MTPDEKNKIEARIAEHESDKKWFEEQRDSTQDPQLKRRHNESAEEAERIIKNLRAQLEKE